MQVDLVAPVQTASGPDKKAAAQVALAAAFSKTCEWVLLETLASKPGDDLLFRSLS